MKVSQITTVRLASEVFITGLIGETAIPRIVPGDDVVHLINQIRPFKDDVAGAFLEVADLDVLIVEY